jgi:Nuclease-related domain
MTTAAGDVYASEAERVVGRELRTHLSPGARLWSNQRVTDDNKNAEVDFVLAVPGAGFVCVEVKGGQVAYDGDRWTQTGSNGEIRRIDPVTQARDGMYGLRTYVEDDPRWGSRGRVRWAHAVVFPFTNLPEDFATPSCPRYMAFGRDDLGGLGSSLADIAVRQRGSGRKPSVEDVDVLAEILRGRGFPQADVLGFAAERDAMADRLTAQQGLILEVSSLVRRMEIRGGAGSGKTWLALEQARRMGRAGGRVALLCYSRGLGAYFTRVTGTWPRQERPAYVGTFHGLGSREWGATSSPLGDTDSDYWERRLPAEMHRLARDLQEGKKFDAIVIDEAQDFADPWWPVVLAALKDPGNGRLTIMSDEGQRVFARFGGIPECDVVFVLEQNLRNTRQIADTFQLLALARMRNRGGEGPAVRFVECDAADAVDHADDVVEELLDEGWRPKDIVLLTIGSRHPEQVQRQAAGQDEYWNSFWDDEQVFYGHVLGFKGLERSVVVLALNEVVPGERARERLYVGLSRACDCLVVCGDPAFLERVAGASVRRRLTSQQGASE